MLILTLEYATFELIGLEREGAVNLMASLAGGEGSEGISMRAQCCPMMIIVCAEKTQKTHTVTIDLALTEACCMSAAYAAREILPQRKLGSVLYRRLRTVAFHMS